MLRILSPPNVAPDDALSSLHELIYEVPVLSLATVSDAGVVHINNVFYFRFRAGSLGFISFLNTIHIRNVFVSPHAAASISCSEQIWGKPISGAQLFGIVRPIDALSYGEFFRGYAQRFVESAEYCYELEHQSNENSARPFVFDMIRVKLIDELRFGEETYVEGSFERRRIRK